MEMKLGGFGNTQILFSQLKFDSPFCHFMESHQQNLFYKVDGENVNAKIWKRFLTDYFSAVEEEKDLSSIPDERPYEDRFVDELEARGLISGGKKAELIKSLIDDDRQKKLLDQHLSISAYADRYVYHTTTAGKREDICNMFDHD